MSKSDPRDIDEDAILKGMSPEEIEALECELQEMDPEVLRAPEGPLWQIRELIVERITPGTQRLRYPQGS